MTTSAYLLSFCQKSLFTCCLFTCLLGSCLAAEENVGEGVSAALQEQALPLRITADWDSQQQHLKVNFENLTSKPIFINKLSLQNPKILLYAKVGTSFKSQFFFPGLSSSGLASALRQIKDASSEIEEVPPKAHFITDIDVGKQIKEFTGAIPDAVGQKIKLKLEFSKLIADISKSYPQDQSTTEPSEAFFTPWVPVITK